MTTTPTLNDSVRSIKMGSVLLLLSACVNVNTAFVEKTARDVKKALTPFRRHATLIEDAESGEQLIVNINWGPLDAANTDNGLPMVDAQEVPKLIQRMKAAGFKMSYFQHRPKTKGTYSFLDIGFVKQVPDSKQNVRGTLIP